MKILHILDHSLPLHSGYTFRSQNLFKAQQQMGYIPVVLTSPKHEQSLKKVSPLKEEINGFKYYRTGAVPEYSFPVVSELHLMHRLYKRIMEIASNEKPDIIHAHSPILNGIPAAKAARKLNIPIVYEIRAFWEDAAVDHGTYKENSWKYRLTKYIETVLCKRVDHVCILCNGLKNDLISRGIASKKITPVFNGVNTHDLKPVPPDKEYIAKWKLRDKKVIGFVGSFYRYEGLDLLIRAFARIARNSKDTILLLVGGGEMENELLSIAKELGVQEKLIMPGRIPHERIDGVYSLIDILAYPRYSMRLTELVTPLKPLEAMAMGKTFVASDVGGHNELIQDKKTGILFKAGNVESLANSLSLILNDNVLRENLQSNGKKWVQEHHTWEKTTSVYPRIYEGIVSCR